MTSKPKGGRFQLTKEQKEEFTTSFQLFDTEGKNAIDLHELKVCSLLPIIVFVPEVRGPRSISSSSHHPLLSLLSPYASLPPNQVLMRALGFDLSKQQVVALVREIDPSNHGMVSFETYHEIMTDVASRRDPQEEMKKAFLLFAGEKGLISVQDLKRVCKQLGEKMSEEELGAMVAEFDR